MNVGQLMDKLATVDRGCEVIIGDTEGVACEPRATAMIDGKLVICCELYECDPFTFAQWSEIENEVVNSQYGSNEEEDEDDDGEVAGIKIVETPFGTFIDETPGPKSDDEIACADGIVDIPFPGDDHESDDDDYEDDKDEDDEDDDDADEFGDSEIDYDDGDF